MTEKFDDVLLPFLSLMRQELHANTGKGDRPGWLRMDANTALLEVYYHLAKLQKAVKHNDGPAIMEYSADVANMAMMVLDICGWLAWVDDAAETALLISRDRTANQAREQKEMKNASIPADDARAALAELVAMKDQA